MNIGALQRFSLIEYPGVICAILFTQGCNFRCPYCYNRDLVDPNLFKPCLSETEIFAFLEKRRGKLDAVTLTGGEPTIQPDLVPFIVRLRELNYLVKVDCNGSRPDVLRALIESRLVDYIAMDIKGPLEKYGDITKSKVDPKIIQESIRLIMRSGIDYEFRTTVVRSLLSREDIWKVVQLIPGAKRYALQSFLPLNPLEPGFAAESSYSEEELSSWLDDIRPGVETLVIR